MNAEDIHHILIENLLFPIMVSLRSDLRISASETMAKIVEVSLFPN